MNSVNFNLPKINKIKVFISSAMNNEGGFDWLGFRQRVRDEIQGSDLFDAFLIEDHASPVSSKEFFLTEIDIRDIVVAFAKCELRGGTENELRHALETKKPVMLFLIGKERDDSLRKLIKDIHEKDSVTTKFVDSLDEIECLPKLVVSDLYNFVYQCSMVKFSKMKDDHAQSINAIEITAALTTQAVLQPFGNSSGFILEELGCSNNLIENNFANPYLAPLGKDITKWVLDGDIFSLDAFEKTIKLAMSEAEISEEVLNFRLLALDNFINGNLQDSRQLAAQARESLHKQESWIYGNILIDERSLAHYANSSDMSAFARIQTRIDTRKGGIIFPLASTFEARVFSRLTKLRSRNANISGKALFYDSEFKCALQDAMSYIFVSFLYGSIASADYGRGLVANVIIDFGQFYSRFEIVFQGVKILIVRGDCEKFLEVYGLGSSKHRLHDYFAENACELWSLSSRNLSNPNARMKCILIKLISGYLPDDVFKEVEQFLLTDISSFSCCRKDWLAAINAVKLRMSLTQYVAALKMIIVNASTGDGNDISRLIVCSRVDELNKSQIQSVAASLRSCSQKLLDASVSVQVFALIESKTNETILTQSQIDSFSRLERATYYDFKESSNKSHVELFRECLSELRFQYDNNNTGGVWVDYFSRPERFICSFLREADSVEKIDFAKSTVVHILATIGSYSGFVNSLKAPMMVVVSYCFALKRIIGTLDELLVKDINNLPDKPLEISSSNLIADDGLDAWKIAVCALRVLVGIQETASFLVMGIGIAKEDISIQVVYLQVLEEVIYSGTLKKDDSYLAVSIIRTFLQNENDDIRISALKAYSSCCSQWDLDNREEVLFDLANDSSDEVVFELFRLCHDGQFNADCLEKRIINLLENSPNWYIRWQVNNYVKPNSVS
jgi:hypothetical protein